MQAIVSGETPFKALKNTFCVGPTSSGYTLNYAVSKEGPWTAHSEATPESECLIVNGATPFMWFRLSGNVDEETEIIL